MFDILVCAVVIVYLGSDLVFVFVLVWMVIYSRSMFLVGVLDSEVRKVVSEGKSSCFKESVHIFII